MVFCTYCGQSFTRDEHLERHILTHTNVKPYKCFKCHMSFARRDLLHRHYVVHGRDGNQQPITIDGMIPKSAGRTPIACINCAKTKTKCDKKFPCTRCSTRNLECTVRPTRRAVRGIPRPIGMMEGPPPQDAEPADPKKPDSQSSSSSSSDQHSPKESTREMQSEHQWHPEKPTSTPGVAEPRRENSAPTPKTHQAITQQRPDQQMSNGTNVHTPPESRSHSASRNRTPPLDGQDQITPALTPGGSFAHHAPFAGFDSMMAAGEMTGLTLDDPNANVFAMQAGEIPPFTMADFENLQAQDIFGSMAFPSGDELSTLQTSNVPLMFPNYEPGPGMLATPTSSTGFDRKMPDGSLNGYHGSDEHAFMHRSSSRSSHPEMDVDAIINGQDCWSAYRCTPCVPSAQCPRSARVNLEKLEDSLKDHESWLEWRTSYDDSELIRDDHTSVLPFQEMARDKLLAITQTFLHKALEIHADEPSLPKRSANAGESSNFILLPPARALEYLLKSYCNSFERFYPLTPRGALDPNALMRRGGKDKASSLLLLLMIAQGALISPSMDGRWLAGGLTEACRISLFDLIEKDIMMSGDPIVLHAALLFTVQAGWSGDKWQMDIAMGQRGMYFAMLRHSGYLEGPTQPPSTLSQRSNVEQLWHEWIQQESRSRLVYAWAMVDQDLSLFHDTPPMFSITEFGAPMPDTDILWHAKSAAGWSGIFERVHEFSGGYSSVGSGARPMCLRDLFRLFVNETIIHQGMQLTALQLRLLLHPLQSLVCQFRQLLTCLPDAGFRPSTKSVTAASTRVRLEEVQGLLHRWYDLADEYLKTNPLCPMMQANLVMFHLVSLNAVVDFPKIEQVARRDGIDGSYQTRQIMHKQCLTDVEEAIFHSGQVLRLIRNMPRAIRPPWWVSAVYRAAMIFWCDSLVRGETSTPTMSSFQMPDSSFPVDGLPPDHPAVIHYLTKREGVPALTRRDGSPLLINDPFSVLFYCIDVISEGVSTRFSEGICAKLTKLARS